MREIAIGTSVIYLLRDDITALDRRVGAIVHGTTADLRPGSAVSVAIHQAGGSAIGVECLWAGKLETGQAMATTAGRLDADCVIHVLGPVWEGGARNEDRALASVYRSCLDLAASRGLRSVAFSAISTGGFGFPIDRAATIAIGSAAAYVRRSDAFDEILLVAHQDADYRAYEQAADRWEQMQAARAMQAQAQLVR